MTPKQKYDERKRLRLERELLTEQSAAHGRNRADEFEAEMFSMCRALTRVADVLELWADLQTAPKEV